MNQFPVLVNQFGGVPRSKDKSFTRRQFRAKLEAEREARREAEQQKKAIRKWLASLDRPYDSTQRERAFEVRDVGHYTD